MSYICFEGAEGIARCRTRFERRQEKSQNAIAVAAGQSVAIGNCTYFVTRSFTADIDSRGRIWMSVDDYRSLAVEFHRTLSRKRPK